MTDLNKALRTQLSNIEAKTGKSLAELKQHVQQCGLTKHGQIREMLMKEFDLGYGDANMLVHVAKQDAETTTDDSSKGSIERTIDELYAGPKAALRPIHDTLIARIRMMGEFDIAPKKTYVSLRRKKQFAMIGPATKTRVDVSLNMKGVPPTGRLIAMPPKSMCTHVVRLTRVDEVDDELIAWIQTAYTEAG